ncbi:MAG: hypothetical protein QGG73_02840 [Candidatus Hydrogenedentes bacterium]|nr:hypothetical protein [Candidatus Hydrogenedentota bacterium]
MSLVGLIAIILIQGQATIESESNQVSISVHAVRLLNEGHGEKQRFDRELGKVRGALAGLEYDTFEKIKIIRGSISYGSESKFKIDNRYSLLITPIDKGADGRIRVKIRLEMAAKKPGGEPTKVIGTEQRMPPGKQTKLGGARLDKGELVVVLSLGERPHPPSR